MNSTDIKTLKLVAQREALDVKELANATGVSEYVARYDIDRLISHGMLAVDSMCGTLIVLPKGRAELNALPQTMYERSCAQGGLHY